MKLLSAVLETGIIVVSIDLFLSRIVGFRTMEYSR